MALLVMGGSNAIAFPKTDQLYSHVHVMVSQNLKLHHKRQSSCLHHDFVPSYQVIILPLRTLSLAFLCHRHSVLASQLLHIAVQKTLQSLIPPGQQHDILSTNLRPPRMLRKALQILGRIGDLRPYQLGECAYELRGGVVGGVGVKEGCVC
jgi:hypothetical protein